MRKLQMMVVAIPLVLLAFFETGCTATQRKELLMEGLAATKEYVNTEILPKAKEAAIAYVEKKALEQEQKQLVVLDAQLEKLGKVNTETNVLEKKTWHDFDADKDSHLSPTELALLSAYISKEAAGRPDSSNIYKTTGGAVGILGLAWLALASTKKMRNGKTPVTPPTPSGGTA